MFDPGKLETVREQVARLEPGSLDKRALIKFGRQILQDHPYFAALQRELAGRVSDWVKEAVEPGYNFLSLFRAKQNLSYLLFFHYFPKGMLELTQPERWPVVLNLPNLAAYVGSCTSRVITDYAGYKSLVSNPST